ncbi:hypothetical protein OESDEN_22947 [Oesophagostomum dentatum]|uniref:ATP-dependent DNA helicase n=1 Tax=Oesophagostomum dentatum TaxID=61180 RepID=A0A0B1RWH9_OESDE|nr:hypothetical protein OESDEN_22947 [Oesophagostomum dentatum]
MSSFEDLRTIDRVPHDNFAEAARARDLLHDDASYGDCLEEAARFRLPVELRALFSYMLAFCDRGYPVSDAIALAYFDISDRLLILHCNISDRITAAADMRPELTPVEVNYERHATKGHELYVCLNENQKNAADSILASLDTDRHKLHFIDGPGGSGKTFLYNSLYHILKSQRKSVICVAWTGIAARLLPEGKRGSSTFKLSLQSENRVCNIRREDRHADPLKAADIIIWDEVSMVPKCILEAVDLLFQDLMCNCLQFGEKKLFWVATSGKYSR